LFKCVVFIVGPESLVNMCVCVCVCMHTPPPHTHRNGGTIFIQTCVIPIICFLLNILENILLHSIYLSNLCYLINTLETTTHLLISHLQYCPVSHTLQFALINHHTTVTIWVWILAWAYLKGVSSLSLLHYLWHKSGRKTSILIIIQQFSKPNMMSIPFCQFHSIQFG